MKRWLLPALVLASPVAALADESPVLLYNHGRLLGADDAPVTGTKSITFGLYATDTAETPKWSETYQLQLSGGTYSVALGDPKGQKKTLAAADVVGGPYLGISVDGVPLTPRMRVGTVPFAAQASEAQHALDSDKLGGALAADYAKTAALTALARLDGAAFTGAVTVPAPVADGQAATKGYVDQAVAAAAPQGFAKLSGAAFTGPVTVPAPTADTQAATKAYVDAADQANKSYVDAASQANKSYVDGRFTGTPTFAPATGNVPFQLGQGATGLVTGLNAEFLGGKKASDFVLASDKPKVTGTERLVLDFEEGLSGGTTVTDGSGAGNNGSFAANSLTRTASGHNGSGAINFVAGGGVISVPDADSLDLPNGVTIEAWIYPTTAPASEGVILTKDGSYALHMTPSRQIEAVFNTRAAGTGVFVGSTQPVPLNTWTHVAASYDGLAIRIYLNGQLATSLAAPNGPLLVNTQPVLIGGRTAVTTANFVGTIDEVRISAQAKAFLDNAPGFAQYGAAGWAPSGTDNVIPLQKTFFETGLTHNGNNVRFARTGVYQITIGARVSGTGDIWQAWALYKNGSPVAWSDGFGAASSVSDQGQQSGTFLALVDSTTDDYTFVLRKANGAGSIADSMWGDYSGTRIVVTKVSY